MRPKKRASAATSECGWLPTAQIVLAVLVHVAGNLSAPATITTNGRSPPDAWNRLTEWFRRTSSSELRRQVHRRPHLPRQNDEASPLDP